MADTSRVTLSVDGTEWSGWQEIQVTRSIERVAGTFALRLTERWPGQATKRPIGPGAACTVAIDDETVLTGYVDDVDVTYGPADHVLTVRGRDSTGDLFDCAALLEPFELRNLTLTEIADRLARPFGIPVRAEVDVGRAFARFAIQPGETVFEAIERGCRQRAVLPVADGQGGLVLTRAGVGGTAAAPLVLGGPTGNVLRARGTFSFRDRFSDYVAMGQQEGADTLDAEEAAGPKARAKDPAVTRHRPTVILAEGQGDGVTLAERAAWQMSVSAGRSRRATYTVQDWRAHGQLWRPNTLVEVTDEWSNLAAAELLIVTTTMTLSEAGTLTDIEVAPRSAYDLVEETEQQSGSTSGGKGAGGDPFSLWDEQ